jgi:hypothetical protein
MAVGINIGDEVAIVATVRGRVTEDRISLSIPSYNFPYSIRDRTSRVKKGDRWELVGDVRHIDGNRVTVNVGFPVTVDVDKLRLVSAYKPPIDEPT